MSRALLISVRLHDGRYHGSGDGPPAPARLFQALVAGTGLSGPLQSDDYAALQWLEQLAPPIVATPRLIDGQGVKNFVPNNDLDAVGGDHHRMGEIRTQKISRPRLFDAELPWLFSWQFSLSETNESQAFRVSLLSERVYQFGRGIDLAWAWGEVLDASALDERLAEYSGIVYRPSVGGQGVELACPQLGSLRSLSERYRTFGRRFEVVRQGRAVKQLFSQPSKPRFAQVAYGSPPIRYVFELREQTSEKFIAWPLPRVVRLVEAVRDAAVARLRSALPDRQADVERFLVGRKADGSDAGPTELRVRLVPLPSIGFHHVDHEIRRLLVEVPSDCPLRADDVRWAISGVELRSGLDDEAESPDSILVTPSTDETMMKHYGIGEPAMRSWRTVTPIALPEFAMRRRIEPTRESLEAKGGGERAAEQQAAASAIIQAIRHAEIHALVETIRVQREPFEGKGQRVETFAPGTRFRKELLWHAEIRFQSPVAGPVVLGSGRFLGLGVMAPLSRCEGVLAFSVERGIAFAVDPNGLARALRRAVMSRAQTTIGANRKLPAYFTGHQLDGSFAQSDTHPHLAFSYDPINWRLLVVAPHVLSSKVVTHDEKVHWRTLEQALLGFTELHAGTAGVLTFRQSSVEIDADPYFASSRIWESVTPYHVTRHAKRVGAAAALTENLIAECRRRSLPKPKVEVLEAYGQPGIGLTGNARLTFSDAVNGPVMLGKSRFLGGGLFIGKK